MNSETMNSGNLFIDENHDDLLNNINAITYSVRDNWNQKEFNSSVRNFILELESHFSHEEIILKGAGYVDLDDHSIKHREISMQLNIESLKPLDYNDSVQFLAKLRSTLFSHELFEDQGYWPLFEHNESKKEPLIIWSQELKTGDAETDKHHKALINHINRLHTRFSMEPDILNCCKELQLLFEYSKFHFSEEESLLGKMLRPSHKANHENLLNDLERLINEVGYGKIELMNVSDYLKYWLINHIKTFDVPSFNPDI